MGLFKKAVRSMFRNAAKPEPESKPKSAPAPEQKRYGVISARPWPNINLVGTIDVSGDYENTLYTYDPDPLKGIRKGQLITVELYCGEVTIKNPEGTVADSKDLDDVPVMYEGVVFGFTAIPKDKVRQAAKLGYRLRFQAKCLGMLEGYRGIKEMKIIVPQPFFLYGLVPGAPDDRPDRLRENYLSFYEYDVEDFKELAVKEQWSFKGAKIEMIPTPKGSKAKPHIGIYSKDGMKISEVAAKSGYYASLLEFMERYSSYDVRAKRHYFKENETVCYKIEINGK